MLPPSTGADDIDFALLAVKQRPTAMMSASVLTDKTVMRAASLAGISQERLNLDHKVDEENSCISPSGHSDQKHSRENGMLSGGALSRRA